MQYRVDHIVVPMHHEAICVLDDQPDHLVVMVLVMEQKQALLAQQIVDLQAVQVTIVATVLVVHLHILLTE